MLKVSKLQETEQKHWGGLTRESHLGWLGMLEPQLISKVIDTVYEVNYGADNIVSFLDRLPSLTLEQDGEYEWMLQGSDERNIPLLIAGDTDGNTFSAGDTPGRNRTPFFMFFPERYFNVTSTIVGMYPDNYSLRVIEEPVQIGSSWRYLVELVTGDDNLFVPVDDLTAGTKWSEDFGLVEDTLSVRGTEVKHTAPFKMKNVTSYIRKNYDVPGNMITAGKNKPFSFAFVDQDGKMQTRWIDKLGWDFFVQFRRDKARLILHGKSNRLSDGSYGNKGETGNTIRSGFGIYEQLEGGNLLHFNDFSIDALTDFAMDISVGKLKEDSRKFLLSTGERGLYEFHKKASDKASGFTWLNSGHNFKISGGKMVLDEGQISKYVSVNGIEFDVMLNPMRDDPVRNKVKHPNGGRASSYVYDIWDIGTTNGKPNIQKVVVKDNEEFFGYIPGMRDPFSPFNKLTAPRMMATSKDGYSVFKQYIGGAAVRNPFKTGRMVPNILRGF